MTGENIILFDGICNLCNGAVGFVIRHDPSKKFRFISLQDPKTENLLSGFEIRGVLPGTFILLSRNEIHIKSEAALRVVKQLKGPVKLFYVFGILPRFMRDAIYDFVAKNRYRWFGKKEVCSLPSPNIKDRFI